MFGATLLLSQAATVAAGVCTAASPCVTLNNGVQMPLCVLFALCQSLCVQAELLPLSWRGRRSDAPPSTVRRISLGTWQYNDTVAADAIAKGMKAGFTHIVIIHILRESLQSLK